MDCFAATTIIIINIIIIATVTIRILPSCPMDDGCGMSWVECTRCMLSVDEYFVGGGIKNKIHPIRSQVRLYVVRYLLQIQQHPDYLGVCVFSAYQLLIVSLPLPGFTIYFLFISVPLLFSQSLYTLRTAKLPSHHTPMNSMNHDYPYRSSLSSSTLRTCFLWCVWCG